MFHPHVVDLLFQDAFPLSRHLQYPPLLPLLVHRPFLDSHLFSTSSPRCISYSSYPRRTSLLRPSRFRLRNRRSFPFDDNLKSIFLLIVEKYLQLRLQFPFRFESNLCLLALCCSYFFPLFLNCVSTSMPRNRCPHGAALA